MLSAVSYLLSAISHQLSVCSHQLAVIGDEINRVCTTFLLLRHCPMRTPPGPLLSRFKCRAFGGISTALRLANGSRQTLILGPCHHTI